MEAKQSQPEALALQLYIARSGKLNPAVECALDSWDHVCEFHEHPPEFASKDAMPLYKMARTGAQRKGGVIEHTGVVVECDNGALTATEAAEKLRAAGLIGFVHTSASSTPDKQKWHAWLPARESFGDAEYVEHTAKLEALVGPGVLSPESRDATRWYFSGKVKGAAHYVLEPSDGERFIDDLPAVGAQGSDDEPAEAPAVPAPELAEGGRNRGLMLRAVELRKQGLDLDEIESRLLWLNANECTPPLDNLDEVRAIAHKITRLVEPGAVATPADVTDLEKAEQLTGDGRESGLRFSAIALRKAGRDAAGVKAALRDLNSEQCKPPLPVDAVDAIADEVGKMDAQHVDDVYDLLGLDTYAEQAAEVIAKVQRKARFRVIPAAEFVKRPRPEWIIKGLLPKADLGVIYGESGSGKSFWVLDLALAIVRGVPWRERKTKKLRVVYVCAEGSGGFQKRLEAYSLARQVEMPPLGVVAAAPNLLRDDHKEVIAQIKAAGGADIVVIDTFARAMPGGNENAGEDTGLAIDRCGQITAATGAMVLLIHHAGKDLSRGARGWSGIKAAVDLEIEIARDGRGRCAKVTKSKDGEDGAEFHFELDRVVLGVDEDSDEVSSCVVEHVEAPPRTAKEPSGTVQQVVYRAVRELLDQSADLSGIDSGPALVKTAAVVELAASRLTYEPRRCKSEARRVLHSLAAAGYLVIENGEVRRA